VSGFLGGIFYANIFWGDLMTGYSYFDYDQMTLLGIEVHSDELELLNQTNELFSIPGIHKTVLVPATDLSPKNCEGTARKNFMKAIFFVDFVGDIL